jgi:Family of unknown function (DUF6152)
MKYANLGFAGLAVAMGTAPALAHHTFAMFDHKKIVNVEGTVREFQWTNPHSWIVMMVKNTQGVDEQWAIEIGTPLSLARQGWVPRTLTPGMKIAVTIRPLTSGTRGGRAITVTLPDGTRMLHPKPLFPAGARTS